LGDADITQRAIKQTALEVVTFENRREEAMAKKESSKPAYRTKIEGLDRMIPMRDGTRLAVDIYRPDAEGRFPALLAIAPHNKFLQRPEVSDACRNQREVTRGWLKASHRAVDGKKSRPGSPFHPLKRSTQKPVKPGEITRYDIEISPTSNLFKKEHRICVEITSLDVPTGVAGDSAVEYISYHICSSKTTVHKVYRCQRYPSHLLLPIIAKEKAQ
jgi:predicted acyl esterase